MSKIIKIAISIVIFGINMISGGQDVLAATTISLSPGTITAEAGKIFNLNVRINPNDKKIFTAKVEIKYAPEFFEVRSFGLSGGWMAVLQPGYDLTDNKNGILIKTAGYPGGITKSANFGIISFISKKSGRGAVEITSNSFILDALSANALIGPLAKMSVTITVKETGLAEERIIPQEEVVSPKEENKDAAIEPKKQNDSSGVPLFDVSVEPEAKQTDEKTAFFILFASIVFIILAILIYFVYGRKKKNIV